MLFGVMVLLRFCLGRFCYVGVAGGLRLFGTLFAVLPRLLDLRCVGVMVYSVFCDFVLLCDGFLVGGWVVTLVFGV